MSAPWNMLLSLNPAGENSPTTSGRADDTERFTPTSGRELWGRGRQPEDRMAEVICSLVQFVMLLETSGRRPEKAGVSQFGVGL